VYAKRSGDFGLDAEARQLIDMTRRRGSSRAAIASPSSSSKIEVDPEADLHQTESCVAHLLP